MTDHASLVKSCQERHQHQPQSEKDLLKKLAQEGQKPKTMLITCADSRIEPGSLMGAKPGDLFVIRHVANWVPPFTPPEDNAAHEVYSIAASVEFAVGNVGVEHIIVMGHQKCGGVAALLQGAADGDASCCQQWLSLLKPVHAEVEAHYSDLNADAKQEKAEHIAVGLSVQNLQAYPFVKEAVEQGRLSLHGWYFDIESSKIHSVDCHTFETNPIT